MRHFIHIIALMTITIAIAVMCGWFFDIEFLKQVLPHAATMKFATALSFLLSGFILLFTLKREAHNSDWASIVLPCSSLAIWILMGTTLLSMIIGFESGIENLFVKEEIDAILTAKPGQPSIGTMLAFIIIAGLSIVSMADIQRSRKMRIYQIGGGAITLLGAIAVVGYAISEPLLFYSIEGIISAMAIHTAILFVCIGTGYAMLPHITKKDLRQT